MPKTRMEDGSMRDNLSELLDHPFQHVMVSADPPDGIGFALVGQLQDMEDITNCHAGIPNCRPGIWKLEVRDVPEAAHPDPTKEACLRWAAELDETTELGFDASPEEWKAWEKGLSERFTEDVDNSLSWTKAASFFADDGIFATVSTAYLAREAAEAVLGDTVDDEFDDDEWAGYLETITVEGGPPGYTFGGLHFDQDTIGGPAGVAIAMRDGQVVAVKLFSDEEEEDRTEGFAYGSQPGRVVF